MTTLSLVSSCAKSHNNQIVATQSDPYWQPSITNDAKLSHLGKKDCLHNVTFIQTKILSAGEVIISTNHHQQVINGTKIMQKYPSLCMPLQESSINK